MSTLNEKSEIKQKQNGHSKVLIEKQGNRSVLPKGSSVFQQVLEDIYKEMEEETHANDNQRDHDDIIHDMKESGRERTLSFRRTASVSGGHSGAFVRMPSRKHLLRSKSSREILVDNITIKT